MDTDRVLKEYEIKLGGEKKINADREKELYLWVCVSFSLRKAFEVNGWKEKGQVKIHWFVYTGLF